MFSKKAGGHAGKTEYVSEFTQFINHFLDEHPEEVAKQRDGWRIFWDKSVDLDTLVEGKQNTVPFKKTLPDSGSAVGAILKSS